MKCTSTTVQVGLRIIEQYDLEYCNSLPLYTYNNLRDYTCSFSTGLIDSPSKSLFSYQPGDNWANYYDPYFVPYFTPVFTNPILEMQANEFCEGDEFCLYDIAATGNVDIGLATLQESQRYEEIIKFSLPGIEV